MTLLTIEAVAVKAGIKFATITKAYFRAQLESLSVPDLHKIAKAAEMPYKVYGTAKKKDLIQEILFRQTELIAAEENLKKTAPRKWDMSTSLPKVPAAETAKPKTSGPAKIPSKYDRTDCVCLAQLCKEFKLDGSEVRKHFRSINLTKPGAQWCWDKSQTKELAQVREILTVLSTPAKKTK